MGARQGADLRIHAALVGANLLLGSFGPVLKLVYPHVPPLMVAVLRSGGVAISALAIMRLQGIPFPPVSAWPVLIGLSALCISLNQLMFLLGMSMTSAIVGMLLITTIPIFTHAIAVLWGQERTSALRVAGVGVACAGAAWLVWSRAGQVEQVSVWGSVLIVMNCLCFSWYLVLSKPLIARAKAATVILPIFVFGAATLIPCCVPFILHMDITHIPGAAWMGIGYIILGPTLTAYFLNTWAVERGATASLVALYIYLQPLVAALIAVPVLHDRITPPMMVSALMIFSGLIMVTRTES